MLTVRQTPDRGRGVFAAEDIPPGVVIEECPVIVLPPEQLSSLLETRLSDYFFVWGGPGDEAAIALGLGSLFNHSVRPNAQYFKKYEAATLLFISLRPIPAGEEVLVNYNGSAEDGSPVWFELASRP